MRAFWTVLAILFAALTIGSLAVLNEGAGESIGLSDIAVAAVLGTLAWLSWGARR
ncbi:hypothetical protein ACFU76_20865 [Streptomyces sp. NPDC057539]|uniref:hypothetical protein n=1 Tax=Streptomyces sp. NPDC057539 TaxID=3346159 RepID=UPI003674ECF4